VFWMTIGGVIAIWKVSAATRAIMDVFDRIYGSDRRRSFVELTSLAPQLDEAEVALLADALDNGNDVHIVYRNRAGNRSARIVRPEQLYGRWMVSWCHLRSAAREFTVSGIESVSVPVP